MTKEEFIQKYSVETRYDSASIERLANVIENRIKVLTVENYEPRPTLEDGFDTMAAVLDSHHWAPDQLINVLTEMTSG